MKLIFCPACSDIVRLRNLNRKCVCGKSWGHYTDKLNAVIGGQAIPLGIDNNGFWQMLKSRAKDPTLPRYFEAFTIEEPCSTVKRQP